MLAQTTIHHNGFMAPAPLLPEAACSVNMMFEVQGYGRAQATGRGATPQEAAANLRGTMDATRAVLETPAVKSRTERLSELLTCGLTKATAKGDMALVTRLATAAALVLAGAVSPGEREGMLACQSQTCPSHYYEIDALRCSCPDYEYKHRAGHTDHVCKHGLAAWLYRKLEHA